MGARTDVAMSGYTSFRVGGNAATFFEPRSIQELVSALTAAQECGAPCFIMGNGTNLLISDSGIDALVIRLCEGFSGVERTDNVFTVRAGSLLSAFARSTVELGFGGLEWAAGIPGSVGGAAAMNAGAYGGEIKQVLSRITYLENGRLVTEIPPAESLGYRHSVYCAPDRIVVEAEFTLQADSGARGRMEEYSKLRREKQPLAYPRAGSTFKRPEGHFAGALIEGAGLKGRRAGGAQVSELHAGFIINTGGATARDVYSLIRIVIDEVYQSSGVMLEPEVKLIGEFD